VLGVSTDKPTHIIDGPDVKTTWCGIKLKDQKSVPFISAAFVDDHVKGYGMVVCPECDKKGRK
jgi:hypothetical protein